MIIRKLAVWCIWLVFFVAFAFSENVYNPVTMGLAKITFCEKGGDCNFRVLDVENLSVSHAVNMTVVHYNVTGGMTADNLTVHRIHFPQAIIIGNPDTIGVNPNGIAIGKDANSSEECVALGSNAACDDEKSVAIGMDTRSLTQFGVAIGQGASLHGDLGDWSTVIGMLSYSEATACAALGRKADCRVNGARGVALGEDAQVNSTFGVSIGYKAESWGGRQDIVIGYGATTDHASPYGRNSSTVIGTDSWSNASNAVSIGTLASTYNPYGVAIGYNASSVADNCVAIGKDVQCNESDMVKIGQDSIRLYADGRILSSGNLSLLNNLQLYQDGTANFTGQLDVYGSITMWPYDGSTNQIQIDSDGINFSYKNVFPPPDFLSQLQIVSDGKILGTSDLDLEANTVVKIQGLAEPGISLIRPSDLNAINVLSTYTEFLGRNYLRDGSTFENHANVTHYRNVTFLGDIHLNSSTFFYQNGVLYNITNFTAQSSTDVSSFLENGTVANFTDVYGYNNLCLGTDCITDWSEAFDYTSGTGSLTINQTMYMWAERGSQIISNNCWSFGNGAIVSKLAIPDSATITQLSTVCNNVGTSMDVDVKINGAVSSCANLAVGAANTVTRQSCNTPVTRDDYLQICAGTEVGSYQYCTGIVKIVFNETSTFNVDINSTDINITNLNVMQNTTFINNTAGVFLCNGTSILFGRYNESIC